MINFALYDAAVAADNAYHAELAKVYGERNAGDARYGQHSSDATALNAAHDAKLRADKAWLAEIDRARNSGLRG